MDEEARSDHPLALARTNPHFFATPSVAPSPARRSSQLRAQESFFVGGGGSGGGGGGGEGASSGNHASEESAAVPTTRSGATTSADAGGGGAGGSFAEVDVGAYVSRRTMARQALSFWDLFLRCRRRGHLLVGWRRRAEKRTNVNPERKSEQLTWHRGDILVVARRKALPC